jgi:hypothetical protein
MFAFKKVWNVFRNSYNYSNLFIILITTFWIFFIKSENTKKKLMVESTGLIFVQDFLHKMGSYTTESNKFITTEKRKAIPLLTWTGPEGSKSLRLPDFKTIGT